MNTQWTWEIWPLYLIVFLSGFASVLFLAKRIRKRRTPLDFELLRGPGESLREEIERLNEQSVLSFIFSLFVPPCAFLIAFAIIWALVPTMITPYWQILCGLAAAGGFALSYRYLYDNLSTIRRYELGYYGERAVAEQLAPLEKEGWQIFNDVPAQAGNQRFNLDHVAVGTGGVALIETKTRSKGKARKGYEAHRVFYDGKQLIWPWGEETDCLAQTKRQCKWLEEFIQKRLGLTISVKPILAIPGWYVERKAQGDVTVVNHKSVASAVTGYRTQTLTAEQADLIARQLESLCRDIKPFK